MMLQSGVGLKLALLAALAVPASLAAQVAVAYQPHYLPSVQDAANQLLTLSPHYAPVEDQGNQWALTNSYALARVEVNKQGIKLYFSRSPAQQIQFLWNWNRASTVTPYAPYTGDIITTMLFANTSQFRILNFNQAVNFPATWCVNPDNQPAANNSMLCIDTRENALGLLDALATLVVASGGDLVPNDGFGDVSAIAAKQLKKYPSETGGIISSLASDGAPAKAGIQAGDILHAVNGKPYVAGQGMVSNALREATWHKPGGGVVHVDIFRNHAPMSIDIRYTKPPVDVAKLQRQAAEIAQPAGAPPSGLHFGFQVRPVIADDMAPLMLAKAEGMVVVSVENGGLADTMGILAGDVILAVNGAEAGDMPHFTQLIHSVAVSTFTVWRKGKSMELTVPQSM